MATPKPSPEVAAAFAAFPEGLRRKLFDLRAMIFDIAADIEGVGLITETLKWGQPSYLTEASGSGTTIRLGCAKDNPDVYALFVHCQTHLIKDVSARFGDLLEYEGNRAVLAYVDKPLPAEEMKGVIAMALTYHARKNTRLKASA